jgi:tyrosine-protein phosphatase SIW14
MMTTSSPDNSPDRSPIAPTGPTAADGRMRRRAAIILALLIVSVAGFAIARNQPCFRALPKRFAAVEDGVLYRSSQPTARQLANLVKNHGIKTLLVVREGDGESLREESDFAKAHGISVVHIPIKSREPISDDQIRAFFGCVDGPANRPVLIHCSAGKHRTGFLCALYRIERQGWPVDRAVDEMLSFNFDTEDQAPLLNQLRQYVPRRTASAPVDASTSSAKPANEGTAAQP